MGCQRCRSRNLECVYINEKTCGRKRKHALNGVANSKPTRPAFLPVSASSEETEVPPSSGGVVSRRQSLAVPASISGDNIVHPKDQDHDSLLQDLLEQPSDAQDPSHFDMRESVMEDVCTIEQHPYTASLAQQRSTTLPGFMSENDSAGNEEQFFSNMMMPFNSNDLLTLADLDHDVLHMCECLSKVPQC